MAEAARARAAPHHPGLPEEIIIWEILPHLPPKDLLRCRAVSRTWRGATSTREFLLAHHARQPTLPLLNGWSAGLSVDIVAFDHRAGIAAPDQLQSLARLGCGDAYVHPKASCDGLLIYSDRGQFSICNPVTRQYAPLPQLHGFDLLGMYRHSATNEYRLLLGKLRDPMHHNKDGGYIFALGSGQPPRHIGYLEGEGLIGTFFSVLLRGNLHWHIKQHFSGSNMIMVFDTTTELFRQMQAPAVPHYALLFVMDDVLGLAIFKDANTIIDIWMMEDYESQVWAVKCRIALPVEKICTHLQNFILANVVVMPADGELLVLVQFYDWLHHVDINGKLVASFRQKGLFLTPFRLKQTLVLHTLFSTLEGYVVNHSPFI